MKTFSQTSSIDSPWSLRERVVMLVWEYFWIVFCVWTPKPLNAWRLLVLRSFGATILGAPFVHQRARIQIPWNLILHDGACVGDRANLYSLGKIEIGARSIIAQEAYLCTGTHVLDDPNLPLAVGEICVEEDVFVGARAFILPEVRIGKKAVIGACSVVTRDVPAGVCVAGNPARPTRTAAGAIPPKETT